EAPVRALAEIGLEPLEKRRRIDAGRQSEVLTAEHVIATRATEPGSLADHRSRNIHPNLDVLLRDPHRSPPRSFSDAYTDRSSYRELTAEPVACHEARAHRVWGAKTRCASQEITDLQPGR